MSMLESFIFYSSDFLVALADFLISEPVIYFVVFGLMLFIATIVKRLISV